VRSKREIFGSPRTRRRHCAMKGKRKEAQQVNENGEVRGVPGMGEKQLVW
jgi:hypothetical protein